MKIELLKKEIYNVLENNRNNDFHVKTITTLAKEIGTSRQSIYDVFNLKNGKIKNNTQKKLENRLAQQQHKNIGKTKIKVYKGKKTYYVVDIILMKILSNIRVKKSNIKHLNIVIMLIKTI